MKYPQVFDDVVLDNIKTWLTEDNLVTSDGCIQKGGLGDDTPTESELLTTYATGLLAIALGRYGEIILYCLIHLLCFTLLCTVL